MYIPLVDLTHLPNDKNKKILQAIKKIVTIGNYILGEDVQLFEKNFAAYTDSKYAVGVGSGTDALILSLKALGLEKGDEVIIPAMTFIATANAVLHCGAKPIFTDILPNSPLIDSSKIEEKITKHTKAIIPVHLYGYPCDMDYLKKLAKKYNLFIVEDACQSHGTLYKNKKTGSLGDIAAFSFYPSKNLGAFGDGGVITTSNKKLFEKITSLRNHGQKIKSIHDIVGYNSRLDTLQAAILNVKLGYLDDNNMRRRKNAMLYDELLDDLPIIRFSEEMNTKSNYHIYGIQTEKRDKLFTYLLKKGIHCGIHYPIPLHLQPAFSFLQYKKFAFPHSEKFAKQTLSLPMYPELTKKQINYIGRQIKSFFK